MSLEIPVALLRCDDCKKLKMEIIFNRAYLNKSYFRETNFVNFMKRGLYYSSWVRTFMFMRKWKVPSLSCFDNKKTECF